MEKQSAYIPHINRLGPFPDFITPIELMLKPSKVLKKGKALHPEVFSFQMMAETWFILSGKEGINFFAQLTLEHIDVFTFRKQMYPIHLPGANPPEDLPKLTKATGQILKNHFQTVGEYEFTELFTSSAKKYFKNNLSEDGTIKDFHGFVVDLFTHMIGTAFLGKEVFKSVPKDLGSIYKEVEDSLMLSGVLFPFLPKSNKQKAQSTKEKLVTILLQLAKQQETNPSKDPFPSLINSYLGLKKEFGLENSTIIWLYNAMQWSAVHYSGIHGFWLMVEILSNPALLEALLKEQEAFDTLDWDAVTNCKILQGTVRESIRLHPVFMIPRRVIKDIKFKDYLFPKGSVVAISPYLEHQNPEVFINPEELNPYRWNDPTNLSVYTSFIPGGLGHFGCLGMMFAIHLLTTFLAMMLRSYQFEFKQTPPQVKESLLLLPPTAPLEIGYKKRSS